MAASRKIVCAQSFSGVKMRCPGCGSENPPASRECLCGHSLSTERDGSPPDAGSGEEAQYFPVSPFKFGVMSVLTLGIYQIYWFYKCWRYVRERDDSDIWPPVRALFAPLTYPLLLRELNDDESRMPELGPPVTLPSVLGPSAGYFVTNSLWSLPALLSWLGLLSFLPLLPALRRINALNGPDSAACARNSRWRVRHALLLVVAGPLLALGIADSAGLLPPDAVQSGDRLSSSAKRSLQETILKQGEDVLYFYVGDPLSFSNDGSLLTDRRVVSYWTYPETGELEVESATFPSIRSVGVEYGRVLDPTVVTIHRRNGTTFSLQLPTAQGGDQSFVNELAKRLPFGIPIRAK